VHSTHPEGLARLGAQPAQLDHAVPAAQELQGASPISGVTVLVDK